THVAAGTEDDDAANIAQLKAAMTHYYSINDDPIEQPKHIDKDTIGIVGDDNIETFADTVNRQMQIKLKNDITVDSVTVNKTINVGGDTTITGDTITTKTFKAGDTTINNDGMTIKDGPTITKNNVDMNNQQIHNVAPGEAGTDAVNVNQLNDAMNQTSDRINQMGDQINQVDNRMRKGLAGAAALAALHPLDFDPDDKLTFAAGMGNYGGENACAVGAFYRPDEKTMFSVGGSFGNGENMVNAGVSFSLDRVAHVTNSKTAMAREILDLRREVTELKAAMASGNWMLDPSLTRLFPDTEENHWAYEYVKTLAGNHIIEGYPDGLFKGDRMITSYEMAAILYRAMMNGAKLPDKALNEFAPEMGRFRVDRVYGNGDDRHKVERIRVNDENRKERDVYGSEYDYFKKNPGANVSTGALPGTRQAERAAKAEAAAVAK
ncbi:MAG: YadA-like family protein, partial [Selenomonas sp.]|nr:YadA-like family protein [Selenomonas sp.]